jgi:5-methylthioadenosine/S-adenosylhomocysteine deaminase
MPDRAIRPLALTGKVVTFDPERPVIERGTVYVGPNDETTKGRIEAVQESRRRPPAGFSSAGAVRTRGVIYPGLIDLHNHVVYNVLPLWAPPGRTEPFGSRDEWPRHGSYEELVSDPANALGALAGKAHLKYVETKAVVGGVTAIQGSAKMAYPYEGWLVRNVEYETFRTGKKSVFQSALPLRSPDDYGKQRANMLAGSAFLYHVSEGTKPEIVREYDELRDRDCLQPTFVGIHCTALRPPNFSEWAPRGGSIVWSPFSNLWLYRDTTDVVAARDAGLRVCLGADWSPSGSKTLLGELKVADLWNRRTYEGELSARELCEMATCNPAEALGWADRLGRLRAGLHGDVLVTTDRHADVYRNLIEATEADVQLVAINGEPFYGTTSMMRAAGAANAEPIRFGRLRRSIVLIYPGYPDADMGWRAVQEDIAAARADPVKRYLEIERAHRRRTRPPPWLRTDKPWDDPAITGRPVPVTVRIPPPDSLHHDAAYFRAVARAPVHGGTLDGLVDYYRR